jgi:carbamoylphosphate synthase small subunit
MSAAIMSNTKVNNAGFYSDIMSDAPSVEAKMFGPKVESNTTTSYFAEKRLGTKDQCVGIDGMDSMVVVQSCIRSRGIRASEIARSQAWELRQKIQRNQEVQKQGTLRQQQEAKAYATQKQQEKDAQKQQKERDMQQFQQKRRELESPMPIYGFKTTPAEESEPVDDNTAW